MSQSIDERIVEMKFKADQFTTGVKSTMDYLDKLKSSLNFATSTRSLDEINTVAGNISMGGLNEEVQSVGINFSKMQVIAIAALTRITNSAMTAGKDLVKSFTVDPITDGLSEYETKINAIQTILSNTSTKGTTLDDVTGTLDSLNTYADKTIYNFAEMTKNIGTFTAAGVGLDTAATAIKGIANLAAASGSNSQQASTAMYQLSQAMATGTVKLMDWNSVVNAGMGGEKFQEALKTTARQHGVAVDEMIASNGSFRESLQEGWLTTDILNDTLNNFTVEGAAAYTKAQMEAGLMTQEQADAMNKEAQSMEDAATKVKTFTQLMDTLKEAAGSGWAKTWEIFVGNFDEAKELFTNISDTIGGMINASSDARNNVLQQWKDNGARTTLIDALSIAFNTLMSVITSVKEAFETVFPPVTAQQLILLTDKFKILMYSLKISDDNLEKLKSTFSGFFSIISLVIKVIKQIGVFLSPLLSIFAGLGEVILSVGAIFGDWITGLNNSFTGIDSLGDAATNMSDKIQDAFQAIDDAIHSSKAVSFLDTLKNAFDKVAGFIGKVLSGIFEKADLNLDKLNIGAVALGTGGVISIGALLKAMSKALSSVKDLFGAITGAAKALGDTAGTASKVLGQVKDGLKTYQDEIKANTIMKIAIAVGILAVSILLLSTIDPVRLATALAGMTASFGELILMLGVFGEMDPLNRKVSRATKSLILVSIAVLILAIALKKLSSLSWKELAVGLVGITVLLKELTMVAVELGESKGNVLKGAGTLIAFAIALKIMASALMDLSQLSWKELAVGLVGIGVLLAAIAVFTNKADFSTKMTTMGVGLIAFAIGIKIMASAVAQLADLGLDQMSQGLIGVAASLAIIIMALKYMPDDKDMLDTGAGLVVVAVGLKIIAGVVSSFAGMTISQLATGLIGLGGALGLLAAGLYLMDDTMSGSLALSAAAMAVSLLVPPLLMLGKMKPSELITAIYGLAAAFAVFGIAATVLEPIIPAMLGLAIAMIALGVGITALGLGVFLAGAGLEALAAGFVMLAALAGEKAEQVVDSITTIVTGLLNMWPTIAESVAEGLIVLSGVIIEAAPAIAAAVVAVIAAILEVLVTVIPAFVNFIFELLTALAQAVSTYLPMIVDAGLTLIVGLLEGLSQNIPLIIQAGVDVVVAFVNGIASAIPQLVDGGMKAAIAFLNGMADAIRDNTPALIAAGQNLASAIKDAIIQIFIASLPSFVRKGWELITGVGSGVDDGTPSLWSKFKSAVDGGATSAREKISTFVGVGKDIVGGLIEGIGSKIGSLKTAAWDAATSAYNSACKALDSHSPSRKFMSLGANSDDGLAIGFMNNVGVVISAAKNVAVKALDASKKTVSIMGSSMFDSIDVNPVITPVMDLSEIQNGVNGLDNLVGGRSVSLAANANVGYNVQTSIIDKIQDAISTSMNKISKATAENSGDANVVIEVPVYIDGREVAKATAPYSRTEINKLNTLQNKLGGIV